jgi:hypothetical protein
MKTKFLYVILIVALLLSACSAAFDKEQGQGQGTPAANTSQQSGSGSNQQQGGGNSGGGRGTPPAEAIAACNGKAEQDACQFTDQNGDHTGVCKTNPDNQFACAPDRGPND